MSSSGFNILDAVGVLIWMFFAVNLITDLIFLALWVGLLGKSESLSNLLEESWLFCFLLSAWLKLLSILGAVLVLLWVAFLL